MSKEQKAFDANDVILTREHYTIKTLNHDCIKMLSFLLSFQSAGTEIKVYIQKLNIDA